MLNWKAFCLMQAGKIQSNRTIHVVAVVGGGFSAAFFILQSGEGA
jgi:hypothetical protein